MNPKVNKYISFLLFALVLFLPFFMFGAEIPKEDAAKMVNFLKGDGDFESWFMEAFTKLDVKIDAMATSASRFGRAIGGIGALIMMSVMGWRMQNGEADWSIEPLIKPLVIGLILIYWTGFCNIIQAPFAKLAEPSQNMFHEIEKEANDKRTICFQKQMQVTEALFAKKAELMAQKAGFWENIGKGEFKQAFGDQIDKLTAPLMELDQKFTYHVEKALGSFLETVCLMILRVCVYFIFFIQKIWSYVLIVLGPIAVGISLVPGFDNSIYNWISKFININLYTFIAFTIINIGQQIIMAGYDMDISRLSAIVGTNGEVINPHLLMNYNAQSGLINSVIFPCVGYLVTAAGILMTPTIADTIVTAGGAGVMTKAKQAVAKTTSGAKSAGTKVATGVRNVAGAMAGNAVSSARAVKQAFNTLGGK